MAVKYIIPYRSIDDTAWRIDIIHDDYVGDPINVRGHADNACIISYDGGVDDPFDNPIVTSKANIQLINQGEIDMDELQYAGDRDFIVEVYRDNVLKWKGYLITDNIQQPYQSAPNVIQLSAIDGLNMLEGITYTHANLITEGQGIANRAPLNFLRQCLFASDNLGMMLPIRWHIGLEAVSTSDDALAGMMTWSPYGEGFIDGYYEENGQLQPRYKSCQYIVEGLVKAFKGARIFQANGAWNIFPPNDIIGGSFTYNECDATLSAPTITQHTVDITKSIYPEKEVGGDYKFIREDGLITVKPALGMVDVEYDADRRENILPNGGMDLWVYSFPNPLMYWGFEDNPNTSASYEEFDSLTGQPGRAVQLTNEGGATEEAVFTFEGGLPVDANILFKRMTFGFTFMPTQFGFIVDENGIIDWSNNPLKISVMYTLPYAGDDANYYLNEFGYWQNAVRGGDLGVTYVRRVSQYVPPPNEAFIHHMYFEGAPNIGDELVLSISPHVGTPYTDYSFVVTPTEEGNLGLALDGLVAALAGSPTSNRSVSMTGATEGYVEFRQAASILSPPSPKGSTRKSGAVNDFEFIYPTVDQLKPLDIANIVFQGKGGNTEILIPDPGLLDGQQDPIVGKLYVRFYVKPGQRYVLDEIWGRVEDNNDVFRVTAPGDWKGKSQRITMPISSSFSGFMTSNLMRNYHQSNEDFIWTDGATTASLTEHYARAVMRWRYKPSKIFNGTINTRTKDWSFLDIYALYGLEGRKFLPLRADYNTEKCEVANLSAMEGRDDGEITTGQVKHYASNNMPLSNYGG